ncbi:hypothetical protein TrST_g13986 [Triparma strigata]|uniref:Uncharacterized protein n=1 Tax=Triparma strigata TaxID=1606541 RepID=A0A9W7ERU2_9STRA|nr:hypothetical protein TrST_g13986 [Triparma strigata]
MKVPDSLQKFGEMDFYGCYKLVPSHIDVSWDQDASEIVAYLRSIQNTTPTSQSVSSYNMSMFWSIAVVLFALIVQFAWRAQDEEEGGTEYVYGYY